MTKAANRQRIQDEATERYIAFCNGNRNQLDQWIGNSATRLLAVYTASIRYHENAPSHYQGGSNDGRRFMDWIRSRRDS